MGESENVERESENVGRIWKCWENLKMLGESENVGNIQMFGTFEHVGKI